MQLIFPVSISEMYTGQENIPQLITCIFSDFKCLHLKKYSVVTTKDKQLVRVLLLQSILKVCFYWVFGNYHRHEY